MTSDAASQVPPPGKINLDHLAHFVPDIDSASGALEQLGFTLTPFSAQSHRLEPDAPLVPAGTGNRCVMLKEGYVEFLTPTADTPMANQLRVAIERYVGVHLIAFGTSSPDRDRERLAAGGFAPLAPVALQRDIETASGSATARFTVVRVPPGTMAEGRIQFCQHHTPQLLWQPRWLEHANGVRTLAGVMLCVEDPEHAARRYARFTGLPPQNSEGAWRLETARGYLLFIGPDQCRRNFAVSPPALPWMAGYVLRCERLRSTSEYLARAGFAVRELGADACFVESPSVLGGLLVFTATPGAPLALD